MHWIDWGIVGLYLAYITWDGVRLSRRNKGVEGYFLADRSLPWWAVGLSVMATQLSAITMVGTTGQGYADGMRFVQFYFGLPVAMIVLSVTVVPFFYKARVFTAYEYLERRFDARTRALTSLLFLASRGLAVGVIVAAPSVILSIVLGWSETWTILAMGLTTTIYTMYGGVQAVTWTDVKQMFVIFLGLGVVLVVILSTLPSGVGLGNALTIAGAAGRLQTIDLTFNGKETYTFWSGLIGGLFLMLSYFGCDQSQVQRFLTARSVDEGRVSLLMSAFVKIPMQFVILLIGVLVFVFYQFVQPPLIFKKDDALVASTGVTASRFDSLQADYGTRFERRRAAAIALMNAVDGQGADVAVERYRSAQASFDSVRSQASALVVEARKGAKFTDVNYVFPTFITEHLPIGMIGLLIAAIFAAAMSSIAAELNSLSTATVIDFYRRHFRPDRDDRHYLLVSKVATLFWGLVACGVALYAGRLGSLIEVVNKLGSYFYGSLLGVFVLALGVKWVNGTGAFWGLVAGMVSVFGMSLVERIQISFLWYNVIGCVVAVCVGMVVGWEKGSPASESGEAGDI